MERYPSLKTVTWPDSITSAQTNQFRNEEAPRLTLILSLFSQPLFKASSLMAS